MVNPRTRDFPRTRALLIETAGQLFASRGYDRTSVDAIIRQAGVSKGAFYHHFSSKEELLDAVTDFIVEDALQQIGEAVSDRTLGATVRLNRFLNASTVWRLAHFGLWREVAVVLLRDVNAPMLRKIQVQAIARSAPMLAEIIQQGVEEGVFDPPNPLETARLILQLGIGESGRRSCATSSRRCRRGPSCSWNSGRSCSSPCWSGCSARGRDRSSVCASRIPCDR